MQGKVCRGGKDTSNKKTTPMKPGSGNKCSYNADSLVVSEKLQSGPSHPLKVKYCGNKGTNNVSKSGLITGPIQSPKQAGEHSVNTFVCDDLNNNNNIIMFYLLSYVLHESQDRLITCIIVIKDHMREGTSETI